MTLLQLLPAGIGSDFYDVILKWQDVGVFDVILPFLLVFSIAFGIMEKLSVFGSDKKNLHLVISLVIGLFFLRNPFLTGILQRFLPNVSLFLIVLLLLLLVVGVLKGGEWRWGATAAGVVGVLVILVALSTDFFPGIGTQGGLLGWWEVLDPSLRGLLVFGLIVGLIVWFVKGRGGDGGPPRGGHPPGGAPPPGHS